jgi:hypothetical protein
LRERVVAANKSTEKVARRLGDLKASEEALRRDLGAAEDEAGRLAAARESDEAAAAAEATSAREAAEAAAAVLQSELTEAKATHERAQGHHADEVAALRDAHTRELEGARTEHGRCVCCRDRREKLGWDGWSGGVHWVQPATRDATLNVEPRTRRLELDVCLATFFFNLHSKRHSTFRLYPPSSPTVLTHRPHPSS